MQVYEIILQKDQLTGEEWRLMIMALAKHAKGIRPFSVAVRFKENLVQYFLISKKDLSQLSSGIEGVIISSASGEDQSLVNKPDNCDKLRFLKIPTGGNLLDLRERYKVQESLELRLVYIDVQRIGHNLASKMHSYFYSGKVCKAARQQLTLFPAHLLQVDFASNSTYIRKSVPKYLNIEKSLHIMNSDSANALFSVNTFPYLSQTYYINANNYEFDKHSFIIGASGSGKSKLIELFIDRIAKQNFGANYRIIVIDPHDALAKDLGQIPNSRVVNFSGESTQLFPDAKSDVSASTELTTSLFKSLMADQYNPKLERVLRFSLYVLFVAQSMSMQKLKEFLVDLDKRTQILDHVKGYVPTNIQTFFGSDFNEIRTQYYNEAILPIISLIDEMQLQPSLVGESEQSLAKTIQDNFLTVFSLNKVNMGEKVVKTVAGLLIQQIFLLAQARVFSQRVILIVDEVSVVQNPTLAQILAEARKFNLTVILTQQYFGQIEKELQNAILSNVLNYYVFKVSEEDARSLEGNIEIQLPDEIMAEAKNRGLKEAEVRAKIMVELHPRDCLLRLSAQGQLLPAILARTVNAPARALNTQVQDANLQPYQRTNLPPKYIDKETLAPMSQHTVSTPLEDSVIRKEISSYGLNLADILARHSSREKKTPKKGER